MSGVRVGGVRVSGVRKPRLLLLALVSGVLLLSLLIGYARRPAPSRSYRDIASSFFTDPAGTKAIFLVLERLLPGVERWLRPLSLLPDAGGEEAATLLVMGPRRPITLHEAARLDEWVRGGGQLIAAAAGPWALEEDPGDSYLARHGFHFAPLPGEGSRDAAPVEYPAAGGSLLLGGGALQPGDYTVLVSGEPNESAGGGEAGPAGPAVKAGQVLLGAGRIIVVADERAWANRRLADSANAAWLVATALQWGNGRVAVDEYHHGFQRRRGTLALLASFLGSLPGLFFVQLAAAGALLLVAGARRFGPLVEAPEGRRRSAPERAEALGALLQAARARSFAVRSIHQHLGRRLWQSRYGSPRAGNRAGAPKPSDALPEHYLQLVHRATAGPGPGERELVQVARQAGAITKERQHGREDTG